MRKVYYDTYKKLGICVVCGKNKARPNKVACEECAKKDASKNKNYDKVRKSAYLKRKRELCDAFGICTSCCTREKYKGKRCKECYSKYIEKQKEKGIVPRVERFDKDLCYICAKPVEEGYCLCPTHLNDARKRLIKLKENKKSTPTLTSTNSDKKAYRRQKREIATSLGICPSCLSRPKYKGYVSLGKQYKGVLCFSCYLSYLASYRRSQDKKGIVPIDMRVSNGLCYICASPSVKGECFCERHLSFSIERASKGGKASSKNHPWRSVIKSEVILSQIKNSIKHIG